MMIAEYWPATVIRSGEDPDYSVCAKQSLFGNSLRRPCQAQRSGNIAAAAAAAADPPGELG